MNPIVIPKSARFALLVGLLFVLFWQLGAWGPLDPTEGRYAEIAREMFRSGDYVHPSYLGIHHYHKPPLTYWVTAAAYALFGVSTFAARFFLQVAFLLQCLLLFRLARRTGQDRNSAWVSVLAYASMLIVWISLRDLSTDAYLNLFVLAATLALVEYGHSARARFLYVAAAFSGLGFMTKITALPVYLGPIAVAVWYLYRDRWKWSIHVIAAAALFLVIALWWFVQLEMEGIHALGYVLYYQSLVRYTADEFHRGQPFYFYLALAPVLAFPWALLAAHALVYELRTWSRTLLRDWGLLCAAFLVPLLFFSFSRSKLVLYILPAFPFLALQAPRVLSALGDRQIGGWRWVQHAVHLLVAMVLFLAPRQVDGVNADLTLPALAVVLVPFLVGRFASADPRSAITLRATAFMLVLAAIVPSVLASGPSLTRSTRPVVDRIDELGLAGRSVFVWDDYVPSVAFHLDQTVATVVVKLGRELQFEQDDAYRRWYFDLREDGERDRLLGALAAPSVLLVGAGRLERVEPEIRDRFEHEETVGAWALLY